MLKRVKFFPTDTTGELRNFYIFNTNDNGTDCPPGTVLVEIGETLKKGHKLVGIVSTNSPFGQTTCFQAKESLLQEAPRYDVLIAINLDHPHPHLLRTT